MASDVQAIGIIFFLGMVFGASCLGLVAAVKGR